MQYCLHHFSQQLTPFLFKHYQSPRTNVGQLSRTNYKYLSSFSSLSIFLTTESLVTSYIPSFSRLHVFVFVLVFFICLRVYLCFLWICFCVFSLFVFLYLLIVCWCFLCLCVYLFVFCVWCVFVCMCRLFVMAFGAGRFEKGIIWLIFAIIDNKHWVIDRYCKTRN